MITHLSPFFSLTHPYTWRVLEAALHTEGRLLWTHTETGWGTKEERQRKIEMVRRKHCIMCSVCVCAGGGVCLCVRLDKKAML